MSIRSSRSFSLSSSDVQADAPSSKLSSFPMLMTADPDLPMIAVGDFTSSDVSSVLLSSADSIDPQEGERSGEAEDIFDCLPWSLRGKEEAY